VIDIGIFHSKLGWMRPTSPRSLQPCADNQAVPISVRLTAPLRPSVTSPYDP